MKKEGKGCLVFIIIVIALYAIISSMVSSVKDKINEETIHIISSTDNKNIEKVLTDYAKESGIKVSVDYAGTLEIMDKLNSGEQYDAVWASNSMWLYMLDSSKAKTSDSKIINMNPVVFAIKKSVAKDLGFVGKEVKLEDIIVAIRDGKLKFAMTSATQTNTGACAYLGFLSVLAGNPEVLTEEYLNDQQIKDELTALFSGVNRSSGSEEYLEEMYLDGQCDAIVTYETSIINVNKNISNADDQLYGVYTVDGVSISDSVFAYLGKTNTEKEEAFLQLQSYLLSKEGQEELMKTGRRTWYGGVKEDVDKTIFNPEWGIDTTKYLIPIKYPSTEVIQKALGIYQSELRKPTHTVFALDYSGSMSTEGIEQLREAMDFILTEEEAAKNYLQFSEKDKISFILFNSYPSNTYTIENGLDTETILNSIKNTKPTGGTNIYDTVTQAIEVLKEEDREKYNVSIVLMTDGVGNSGNYNTMKNAIKNVSPAIPVYSIMFGSADDEQLEDIADLSTGKVFDGRTNLLEAFKVVRGYN